MEKLIIFGHMTAAQIFYDILKRDNNVEIVAFTVHRKYINKDSIEGIPLLAFEDITSQYPPGEYKVINGVGYGNINRNREQIFQEVKELGYKFFSYIHPLAINLSTSIAEGIFVLPGAILEPYSTIASNTVICSNVVIAHHVNIAENCWIASGTVVSGQAKINKNTFVGVNATIVNKIIIEEYNIIGAQTLISKNTIKNGVYLSRSGEAHRFDSTDYAKFYLV